MATSPAFGRRANAQFAAPRARPAAPVRHEPAVETTAYEQAETVVASAAELPSVEDELREWKQNRKSAFAIPWRQLSLLASLFFGLASFVLPDGVNGIVNWLLYALMAVSFCVGISRRRKQSERRPSS